jgi:hypothetical protein
VSLDPGRELGAPTVTPVIKREANSIRR